MFKRKSFSSGAIIGFLVVFIVLSVGLIGCSSGAAGGLGNTANDPLDNGEEQPPPLVEGWVLPVVVSITGSESELGFVAAWGFDYGVKVINEQGGIRGVPVSITIRDVASDNTKTSNEVAAVADDALIIVGPPTESQYKAGERVFFNAGMPAVGAATDSDNRETFQPFAISCISDPGSAAQSATEEWIEGEKFTSAYMLYSPENQERSEYVEKALKSGGIQVIENVSLGSDAFNAVFVAEKAIESGAEAFYIDTSFENSLRIVEQLKLISNGTGKQAILCGPQAADPGLLEADENGDMIGVSVWTSLDLSKDNEKRKAFNDAFNKNIESPELYSIAVDYYQSAIMLKQAIDTLGLSGSQADLASEREKLANYLFNTEVITTDQGDFIIESGSKHLLAKLYKITENGF